MYSFEYHNFFLLIVYACFLNVFKFTKIEINLEDVCCLNSTLPNIRQRFTNYNISPFY